MNDKSKNKKDILLITNIYPDLKNPFKGTFVYQAYLTLFQSGFKIEVVSPKNTAKNSLISKIVSYLKFINSSYHHLKKNEYKIVYIHYANHSLFPMILLKSLFKSKKIVINSHGGDLIPLGLINKTLSFLTINQLAKADLLIFPSNFLKTYYLNKHNYKGSILVYPSGGVNTQFLRPSEKLKFNNNFLKLAYFGRIEEGKGWDIFVKTVKILAEKEISFQAIVGGYGRELNKMKKLITDFKLNQYFTFLGAQMNEDLPNFFSKVDLMIFPTKRLESLGLVALEAMACGVPVIGPVLGAIPEYIEDGKNGFLVEEGTPLSFVTKTLEFYNKTLDSKRKMSFNARETAKKYDANKVKNSLIVTFKKLCEC